MKHILLLTDFSKNSINAINYALHLFEDQKCDFYILNVESSKGYLSDDLVMAGNQSIYEAIVKKPKQKLSNLVENFKSKFKYDHYNFHILVDYDVFTDAINQTVSSKNIDLIVMGSNGVTGAKEVVFGSNTINVIRKVDCATLVIPEDFKYVKPKTALLPLDALDSISGKTFQHALLFIEKYMSALHLLRINSKKIIPDEQSKDLNHITQYLKDIPHQYKVVNHVPLEYVVSCYIQTNAIDLTVLIVRKESLFERFFTGSSTTKIGNHIQVPLLVFHQH